MIYPSLEDLDAAPVDQHYSTNTYEVPHRLFPLPFPTAPLDVSEQSHDYHNTSTLAHNSSVYPSLYPNEPPLAPHTPVSPHHTLNRTQVVSANNAIRIVAPVSDACLGLSKAGLSHGVRRIIVNKDHDGKLGVRFRSVYNGVFVQFVMAGSVAAQSGIRFGDQVLSINDVETMGMTMKKALDIIAKTPNNQSLRLAIRDRPFCRVVALTKNGLGQFGFTNKNNRITNIVKDSSASLNGLLIDHAIVEIDGTCCVGLNSSQMRTVITKCGPSGVFTIMPWKMYEQLVDRMDKSLLKKQDHSEPMIH